MTWQRQSPCAACVFVSSQLGSGTPCPFHAGAWSSRKSVADPGEPATLATAPPTADRPWPFTSHEYGCLLLLRSRVGEQRQNALLSESASSERTAAPSSERQPALPRPKQPSLPDWLNPYLDLLTGVRCEPLKELLNDCTADAESDPARARHVDIVRAQVRVLETLHDRGLLRALP